MKTKNVVMPDSVRAESECEMDMNKTPMWVCAVSFVIMVAYIVALPFMLSVLWNAGVCPIFDVPRIPVFNAYCIFGIIWFGAGFFKFTAKGDKNED